MNLIRRSSVLVILACILFISCNKKASKESIVGKWEYKEMIILEKSPLNDMDEGQKKAFGDDAKGTIFQFNKDGTYSVTPGNKEEPLSGTYIIKDGTMTVKNVRHPEGQPAKITFPAKNNLKIEDKEKKIAIVLEKVE